MLFLKIVSLIGTDFVFVHDDDDDDDDDELFVWYGWPTKGIWPHFQPGPLSEILTIANLWHVASKIWTYTESEFRLCWMKLSSSDDHYTTAPLKTWIYLHPIASNSKS